MKKLLVAISIAVVLMGCTEQPVKSFEKQVVTVHAGDTLWSVAGKYSGDTYIGRKGRENEDVEPFQRGRND